MQHTSQDRKLSMKELLSEAMQKLISSAASTSLSPSFISFYPSSDIDVELESKGKRRELSKIHKLLVLESNLESSSNSELTVDSVLSS